MPTIPSFPEVFNDEHHSWHTGAHAGLPMRAIPAGQPGSDLEFLRFHRDFIAKVLQWYFQQPFADANAAAAWTAIPDELRVLGDVRELREYLCEEKKIQQYPLRTNGKKGTRK